MHAYESKLEITFVTANNNNGIEKKNMQHTNNWME